MPWGYKELFHRLWYLQRLNREVYVWKRLNHPNIAKFYGVSLNFDNRPSLVMQWYENGTAPNYLVSRSNECRLEIVNPFFRVRTLFLTDHGFGFSGQRCLPRFGVSSFIAPARSARRFERSKNVLSKVYHSLDSDIAIPRTTF